MNKKKILLVSNGFYPEISPRSFRATELAKEFARQGHQVTVYSKYRDFDYSDFLKKYNINFTMWGRDRFSKVPIFKGKIGNIVNRAASRILQILFEYPAIEDMFKVRNLLKSESGYDLIISFAVPFPVHWGVASARTKTHPIAIRWIADCGDPYMGNTNDTFGKAFYFRYMEKFFCSKADVITVPKIEMKVNYYPEFHEKIREIPQGFDIDEMKIEKSYVNNDVPTFAFAGAFIKKYRDPEFLLSYLSRIKDDFRFVIYTRNTEFIQPIRHNLKNKLIVRDYVPREQLLHELSKMDFLLNIAYDPATQAPSKLIDYAIAGRPILSIPSGKFDTDLIDQFLKGDYTNRLNIGSIERYNIKNVSKLFFEV